MTASEPTTLRAVGLTERIVVVVMSCVSWVVPRRRGSGDRNDSGGPTAGLPPAFRKESLRTGRRSRIHGQICTVAAYRARKAATVQISRGQGVVRGSVSV